MAVDMSYMDKYTNWGVVQAQDASNVKSLLLFLLDYYSVLFGEELVNKELCIVYNDEQATFPMLVTNKKVLLIRLAQKSLLYWAQTIFQLSHEMCHYVFRQYKENKHMTISWYEELVCEAVSLLALEYSSLNWRNCSLSLNAPKFDEEIMKYLNEELARTGTEEFSKCKNSELMSQYENVAQQDRDSRINERKNLYRALSAMPGEIKNIMDYQKYICNDGITIDFLKWFDDTNSPLLKYIMHLMPYV